MSLLCREPLQLPAEHPVFAGHFPVRPIVPGALLLDRVLWHAQQLQPSARWNCRSAKFLMPAAPGQMLWLVLENATQPGSIDFRVEADVGEIASGTLQMIKAGT